MPHYPPWFLDPGNPEAPQQAATDARYLSARRHLAEKIGLPPDAITDEQYGELMAEFSDDKELWAKVEAEAVRHSALVQIANGNAVDVQAVEASKSGLHAYHPERWRTVGDMLRAQLEDLEPARRSSEWYNLRWIVNVFVPYMEAHGKGDQLAVILAPGTKSKVRVLADTLGPVFASNGLGTALSDEQATQPLPAEVEARLDSMMNDVADPSVSVVKFKADHGSTHHRTTVPPMEAYDYKQGAGGFIVLVYTDEAQRAAAEIGLKADWHLGTGSEAFLSLLKPMVSTECVTTSK